MITKNGIIYPQSLTNALIKNDIRIIRTYIKIGVTSYYVESYLCLFQKGL